MDKIKEFKEELAVLLEKYNAEFEAVNDGGCCIGDISIEVDFGEPINGLSDYLGRYVDSDSLRRD